MLNGNVIFWLVLVYKWSMSLWKIYLSHRQLHVCRSSVNMPPELRACDVIDDTTFQRARLYELDRLTLQLVKSCWSVVLATVVVASKSRRFFWDRTTQLLNTSGLQHSTLHVSIVYIFLINTLKELQSLPFEIYHAYVLQRRHDRKSDTTGFFVAERLKSLVLLKRETHTGKAATSLMVLTAAVMYIAPCSCDVIVRFTASLVDKGLFFTEYVCVAVFVVVAISATFRFYICPKFHSGPPFPEGDLKTQLQDLASSVGFPDNSVHVTRSQTELYARVTGLFSNSRIIISDAILNPEKSQSGEERKCKNAEILAILGRELGHWKLNHELTTAVFHVIDNALFLLSVIFFIDKKNLYGAFGFQSKQPLIVGFRIVSHHLYPLCCDVLRMCYYYARRQQEHSADQFAASLGLGQHLRTALIKLHVDTLRLSEQDWLYSSWHFRYPPLLDRLRALSRHE